MDAKANDKGLALINKLVKDYYKSVKDLAPLKMEQREFGVGNYDVKIAYRHLSFKKEEELKDYLANASAPYVSYSSAYYKLPAGRPMEAKGWLGSELVFDLDVTDMSLPCHIVHGKSWVCDECFKGVRMETIKLIEDFLIPDFGFDEKDIMINFSGSRGYHVHVNSDNVLPLDGSARKEITNYISGAGVDPSSFMPTAGVRGAKLLGPRPTDKGWKGKMAKTFLSKLNGTEDELLGLGITMQQVKILRKKKGLIELGIQQGNWDMVYIPNKAEFWKRILGNQAIMQSDRIDSNVTNDPGHLIRLPNSIHGGSGLIAKKVGTFRDLYKFNPMNDAIAFRKGEVKVDALTRYEIIMNGQKYGPYKQEKVTVPTYLAMYMYLKGLCTLRDLQRF